MFSTKRFFWSAKLLIEITKTARPIITAKEIKDVVNKCFLTFLKISITKYKGTITKATKMLAALFVRIIKNKNKGIVINVKTFGL